MRSAAFLSIIAFALGGCESTVTDDGDVGGGTCGACQPGECPANPPTAGDPCNTNIECEYSEIHGDECDEYSVEVTFVCLGLRWVELSNRCSEYIPECPSDLPINGSHCFEEEAELGSCEYDLESSCEPSTTAEARCDLETLTWQVAMPNGSCADCFYVNAAECSAAPSCRWLEPRCDAADPFEPYCTPVVDCAADACGKQEICVEVEVNDCWASWSEPMCCEGTAGVCEAPPPSKD